MQVLSIHDGEFGAFGCTTLAATVILSAATALQLRSRPHLLVRPSMQIAVLHLLFFMWPMTVFAPNLAAWLPDPYALLMVMVMFVGALLAWNLAVLDRRARTIWLRIADQPVNVRSLVPAALLLAGVGTAIMVGYFRVVPLTQTGLVVAMINPEGATIAREESLKLIDDEFTKYAFSVFASGIGPMLGVMLLSLFGVAARQRKFLYMIVIASVFICVLAALSITGARSFAVSTLVAALLAALFRRGFRVRWWAVGISALLCVAPAIAITVLREGQGFDLAIFGAQLASVLGERLFVSPLEVGVTYVHYAQTEGFIGIDSIPKIASLWNGSQGINVPNMIGLSYFGGTALSVSANAGFALSYYAYFGTLGVVIAIACAASLDLVLFSYRWISDDFLIPCVAVLGAAMLALLSIDFTVLLITYGFLVVPLLAAVLSTILGPLLARHKRSLTP